jgi:predicted transcriptional regulator
MKEQRKSPRLTITLDEETRRQVQKIADSVGGSASFIVRKAVKLYLRDRRER